jgi:fructose-1,6-bisphosphatase
LASDGRGEILDVPPTGLHQRTPLLAGSREELEVLLGMLR